MGLQNNFKELQETSFSEDRLFQYIKDFDFPRLAGTKGEKKAVELTAHTFKEIGFDNDQIEKEPFEFSDFYSTTLIKIIAMITCVFLLAFLLFSYIEIIFSFLILAVLSTIVLLIIRGLKNPEDPGFWGKYYGEIFDATNVYVKIPSKKTPEKEAGNIIISAHLDSKSQNIKTMWRVNIYNIFLSAGISFCLIMVARAILYLLFMLFVSAANVRSYILAGLILDIGLWISAGLIILANLFLMFLSTHNNSPGALDNASGMAIVFGLSSFFRNYPLDNFNLWFCQFSAEELGTMGSRIFLNKHEYLFTKGKTFQFNIDMISCKNCKHNRIEYIESYGIIPKKNLTSLCSKYLRKAADQEKIDIYGMHFITGAHTDSLPFHAREFDAIDLGSIVASKWGHTREDTPNKVDPKILRDTCLLLKSTILLLDNDFHRIENKSENLQEKSDT
jgi:hypothetical protein